ncbi:MAG: histidinol-phosphatase [Bacteroidetes bacterium]|nr:histidinol-phosphatase [Bacteroidota bacterium]
MWANFHTHSNYCDGKSSFAEHIQIAKQLQLSALGFSSHAPVPFECLWCMKSNALNDYVKTIQDLKSENNSLEIYAGLEVDFIPDVIGPKQFSHLLDYTIGSIHFVDSYESGKHWEIDGLHTLFLDGLEKIFKNDYQKAFTRYFELTREMIQFDCPTVIGHLDKMKIQNQSNKFFSENESWYQEQVKETIRAISKTAAIVEVNTRGLYQKKSDTTYPSPWILQLLLNANIPITISSDAHHADDLINQFEPTARLLSEIGFKKIHILYHGEWKPFNFNEKGIVF